MNSFLSVAQDTENRIRVSKNTKNKGREKQNKNDNTVPYYPSHLEPPHLPQLLITPKAHQRPSTTAQDSHPHTSHHLPPHLRCQHVHPQPGHNTRRLGVSDTLCVRGHPGQGGAEHNQRGEEQDVWEHCRAWRCMAVYRPPGGGGGGGLSVLKASGGAWPVRSTQNRRHPEPYR